jgi:uncharacterized membrane protein YdjX (TVP38/TMEM64 family)
MSARGGAGAGRIFVEGHLVTRKRIFRLLLLPFVIFASIVAIFAFDLGSYLSFENLADNREWLSDAVAANAVLVAITFIGIYATAVAFSVPGATVLTLSSGFLFGTILGAAYAVIGATLGATALFLIARTSFGEVFRSRTEGVLGKLKEGFGRNALSYLLFLRFVPLFPFFLINLAAGFLEIPTRIFVVGTGIGIIPGALIYASVGNGLGVVLDQGEVPDLGIIFTPSILLPLVGLGLLSLLPVLVKRLRGRRDGTANG